MHHSVEHLVTLCPHTIRFQTLSILNGAVIQKDLIWQGFDREAIMKLLKAYGCTQRRSLRSDMTKSLDHRLT